MKNADIENKIDTLNSLGYKYYVYEHHIKNKVFYVGKGSKYRALDLLSRSFYWESFVKGNTKDIEVVIKGFFENELDALKLEMITIGEYVNDGITLANIQGNKNVNVVYKLAKAELDEKRKLIAENFIPINYSSNPILLSNEFLNVPLPRSKKLKLVNKLSIKNRQGEIIKWRQLKKALEESGYEIIERILVINGERGRTSTLKVKDENLANMLEDININVTCKSESAEINEERKLNAESSNPGNYSSNPILLPNEFLNVPLPRSEKLKLVNKLSIKNRRGETTKWRQLKKMLEKSGYEIIERILVINGERCRTSTLKVKDENLANMLENRNINVTYKSESAEIDEEIKLETEGFITRNYSLNSILLSNEFLSVPLPMSAKLKLVNKLSIKNRRGVTTKWMS